MKLFNLQFGSEIENAENLFFRGNGKFENGGISISQGEMISFDTYFGLFSYSKYKRYCGIDGITLNICGQGEYLISVYIKDKSCADTLLNEVKAQNCASIKIDFANLEKQGFIYFSVTAITDVFISNGDYSCEKEISNDEKIGIVICTFKREEFVKNNLKRFLAGIQKEQVWGDRFHIFVIDNAKTLDLPKSQYYTVVPNKNLGGSGGFTRGICEVCDRAEFTRFLLMDDDIHFEFETLKRTFYLVRALSDKYKNSTVGGAMLYLDKPCYQHEFGGVFEGLCFRSINRRLDVTKIENLLKNEFSEKANYNAWWYTCMPTSVVKEKNLPLPLFIKGDDVEYGIRCIDNLITINGLAIWHQDFSLKYNASLEYYTKRNEQILAAIHSKVGKFKLALKVVYTVFVQLALKRYYCAEVILKAYEDFFKGCNFLKETDMEKLNSEIMGGHPAFIDKDQLQAQFNVEIDKELSKSDFTRKKRNIFRQLFFALENYMPTFAFKNKTVVIPSNSMKVRPAHMKKTVIHFDENRNQGYVGKLDTKRRNKLRRRTIKTFFKIIFSYNKIRKEYKNGYLSVCTRNEWNKKFGLE